MTLRITDVNDECKKQETASPTQKILTLHYNYGDDFGPKELQV